MLSALLMLSACASRAPQEAVHTAFRNSKPRSILVLPVNQTSDINATNGMLSQMTMPLADGGYYVVPVAEMDETFRHNGLTTPSDIQDVPRPQSSARSSALTPRSTRRSRTTARNS